MGEGEVVGVFLPRAEDSSREGILARRRETERRRGVVSTRRISGADGAEGMM